VQDRITESAGTKFIFECTTRRKNFCSREGIDLKYGARHLKRAIERFLVYPLSNLVATEQVETGDLVLVDYDEENDKLTFAKQSGGMIVND
jgi:ATP-dependent Clp protease ATP-binding subunit ClpB